jgi:RNA-directed DNA polymerase
VSRNLSVRPDIRSYFTRIDHQWLRRMVAHRIADPTILRLISKWLRAGALRYGVFIAAEEGTPQGGPISPVLSNVYLHFTLDLWFEKKLERFGRFNLELAEDKTRLLLFGRFAAAMRGRRGLRPKTIEFLGSNMSVGWIEGGALP